MESLGFEPGAAGWKVQKKPRSYGGHPKTYLTTYLSYTIAEYDQHFRHFWSQLKIITWWLFHSRCS